MKKAILYWTRTGDMHELLSRFVAQSGVWVHVNMYSIEIRSEDRSKGAEVRTVKVDASRCQYRG